MVFTIVKPDRLPTDFSTVCLQMLHRFPFGPSPASG